MKNNKIKVIIFDWGRTLNDPISDKLFEGSLHVVKKLSKLYKLVLVSLAVRESSELRKEKIVASGIAPYFQLILVGGEDKDKMYDKVLTDLSVEPNSVAIIDDRVVRGIAWGNRRGAMTIWIKKGKFENELPNEITGVPNFTLKDIREVESLLS